MWLLSADGEKCDEEARVGYATKQEGRYKSSATVLGCGPRRQSAICLESMRMPWTDFDGRPKSDQIEARSTSTADAPAITAPTPATTATAVSASLAPTDRPADEP